MRSVSHGFVGGVSFQGIWLALVVKEPADCSRVALNVALEVRAGLSGSKLDQPESLRRNTLIAFERSILASETEQKAGFEPLARPCPKLFPVTLHTYSEV